MCPQFTLVNSHCGCVTEHPLTWHDVRVVGFCLAFSDLSAKLSGLSFIPGCFCCIYCHHPFRCFLSCAVIRGPLSGYTGTSITGDCYFKLAESIRRCAGENMREDSLEWEAIGLLLSCPPSHRPYWLSAVDAAQFTRVLAIISEVLSKHPVDLKEWLASVSHILCRFEGHYASLTSGLGVV